MRGTNTFFSGVFKGLRSFNLLLQLFAIERYHIGLFLWKRCDYVR